MAIFPNVPIAPGVPAIPRAVGAIAATVELLVADTLSSLGLLPLAQWGLFLNGEPAVIAETVVAFDYKKEYAISSFPVEKGSFESYNKVQRPFEIRLRFAMGGTPSDRQAFEASIQAAIDSLDLYDALTPEVTYSSLNPLRADYRRTANQGVGLLVVDLFCEQVRVSATSSFTSTGTASSTQTSNVVGTVRIRDTSTSSPINSPISPSASPQVNDGIVQPAAPTAAQQAAANAVLSQSMLPF